MTSTITESIIIDSYKELIENYGMEKVSVSELCRLSHIRRQTFYYHFKDLRDLVEFIYRRDMEAVLQENKTYDTWQEGMISILAMIQSQKKFVLATYQTMTRDQLELFLCGHIRGLLLHVLYELAQGRNVSMAQLESIADYHKYGFAGTVMDWVKMGMKRSPEEVVLLLETVIEDSFQEAVDRFEKYNLAKKHI